MRNSNNIKSIKDIVKNCMKGGLFHIFGSSVIAELCGFVSSTVVIRQLPKLLYGQYVDANNLYSYLTVFVGFGLTSAVIQYCSEPISKDEKNAIYRFAFRTGGGFNLFLALVIVALAFWKREAGNTEVARYLAMMAGLPVVSYLSSYQQIVLRVLRRNKAFSASNMTVAIARMVGNIAFTFLWGVLGLIISTYCANIISAIVAWVALKKENFYKGAWEKTTILQLDRKFELLKYSGFCAITNFTTTMLSLLDVTCLGIFVADSSALADYHVAGLIPSACLFVPASLTTYIYPGMVERCAMGPQSAAEELRRLFKIYVILGAVITTGLIIFARPIVWIFSGKKYLDTIPVFRVLCVNFFILGGIRKILGNFLAANKKQKINLIHTVISGGCNILLNIWWIPMYGSMGAAIATVISSAVVAILEMRYCKVHFKLLK